MATSLIQEEFEILHIQQEFFISLTK